MTPHAGTGFPSSPEWLLVKLAEEGSYGGYRKVKWGSWRPVGMKLPGQSAGEFRYRCGMRLCDSWSPCTPGLEACGLYVWGP